MKKLRVILILLAIALLGLFIAAYYARHSQPAPVQAKTPLTHPVLVVVLAKDKAPLLVMQTGDAQQQWISGLDVLMKFDLNHDRRIDKKDAIYPHIGLVFSPGDVKQQKYVALEKAGVKAIVFEHGKSAEQVTVGHAVMTDGTQRKINVLQVAY